MQRPDNPELTDIQNYDTKALRDTRELIEKLTLQDATQYIEQNSHPILWYALKKRSRSFLSDGQFVRPGLLQQAPFG